jgi:hypothetical protein
MWNIVKYFWFGKILKKSLLISLYSKVFIKFNSIEIISNNYLKYSLNLRPKILSCELNIIIKVVFNSRIKTLGTKTN